MSDENLLGENTPATTPAVEATTEAVNTSEAQISTTETVQENIQIEASINADTAKEMGESIEKSEGVSEYDFLSHVSEDLKSGLEKFKSVDDLAKSYVNLEKMMGDSIRIPSEDAAPESKKQFYDKIKDLPNVLIKPETEDGLAEFYSKLGRPESPDAYETGDIVPADLIAQDDATAAELGQFKEIAHKLGLNQEQAQGLMAMRMEQFKQFHDATSKAMETGLEQLHKQWGEDYDTRLKAAVHMKEQLKEKFPDQMSVLLATNANNPALAHMLSELAYSYQEQGVIGQPKMDFGMTPDNARQKIAEKQKDADFKLAYTTESHPAHEAAVEEMKKLYALAYG